MQSIGMWSSISSRGSALHVCYGQDKALELPKEHEMPPRDKYTVFSRHAKGYRKGIHKVPKWTRVRIFRPIHGRLSRLHLGTVDTENKP